MNTLFQVRFNLQLFTGLAIFIFLAFPSMTWYSYIALLISLHQILLLFYATNTAIPIRYLFGTLMCLQMFIGPVLAYNGLDQFQYINYRMKIPEADYFLYVIPAVISFIMGLHVLAGKLKGEILDEKSITLFTERHKILPYWFIGIGFISSLIAPYFSSEFAFVFYLVGSFKYIGALLLILSGRRLKVFYLVLVYGSIILSSLGEGMFHDLLTWLIMLGLVLAIKYKPNIKLKILASLSFLVLALVIQQMKGSYRAATKQGEQAGIETFQKVYKEESESNNLFNLFSLAGSNVRINQGFIITNIMQTVPAKVPYANGDELRLILEAAILPRILAPDKLKAGDRTIFTKYSSINVQQGTSMGLSSVGDAYINFGIVGGCIFMFFYGLLFSAVLNAFQQYSKYYPILLLFTPLVFYYPIRPDCELQTILGHLVKSCFLIFVILVIWKKYFRVDASAYERNSHSNYLIPSR